jgi:hypothetical protein
VRRVPDETHPQHPGGGGRYSFKLNALDVSLALKSGGTKARIEEAMKGDLLAHGDRVVSPKEEVAPHLENRHRQAISGLNGKTRSIHHLGCIVVLAPSLNKEYRS